MTDLRSIPRDRLLAAAALPENRGAAETLLRAASQDPGLSTPSSRGEGAQGATGSAAEGELRCPIDPVGKPRQTQSDKWKQRPAVMRYRKFADDLRAWAAEVGFVFPESGCAVRFEIPMPGSWPKSKKRAMEGRPHQQRLDVDNLCKAVLDALLLPDDCRVWQVSIEKRWARSGAIVFRSSD